MRGRCGGWRSIRGGMGCVVEWIEQKVSAEPFFLCKL